MGARQGPSTSVTAQRLGATPRPHPLRSCHEPQRSAQVAWHPRPRPQQERRASHFAVVVHDVTRIELRQLGIEIAGLRIRVCPRVRAHELRPSSLRSVTVELQPVTISHVVGSAVRSDHQRQRSPSIRQTDEQEPPATRSSLMRITNSDMMVAGQLLRLLRGDCPRPELVKHAGRSDLTSSRTRRRLPTPLANARGGRAYAPDRRRRRRAPRLRHGRGAPARSQDRLVAGVQPAIGAADADDRPTIRSGQALRHLVPRDLLPGARASQARARAEAAPRRTRAPILSSS